jgi:hypothetical protein
MHFAKDQKKWDRSKNAGPTNVEPKVSGEARQKVVVEKHSGGWNSRVENFGGLFDEGLRKKEIFQHGGKKKSSTVKNIGNKSGSQVTGQTYKDIKDVERILESQNVKMYDKVKMVNEHKISNLENILSLEKDRTRAQELNFQKKCQDLGGNSNYMQDAPVREFNGPKPGAGHRPQSSTNKKSTAKNSKKRPTSNQHNTYKSTHTKTYLTPNPITPNLLNHPQPPYEDQIPFYDQLEHLKDVAKSNLPEYQYNPITSNPKGPQNPKPQYPNDSHSKTQPWHPSDEKHVKFASNRVDYANLGRINTQLNGIKVGLDPIVKKWSLQDGRIGYRSGGPAAELVEKSAGRLIRVYNEKLTNLMIDDLLLEIVGILNKKEEIDARQVKDFELKRYATMLMEELNDYNHLQTDVSGKVTNARNVFNYDESQRLHRENDVSPKSLQNF